MVKHEHINEPEKFRDIMNIENPLEKENGLKATQAEINSLKKNKTLELVIPPLNKRIIGSKWTLKRKLNNSRIIQSYKARLIAKGFSQNFGGDYDETFAPVVAHTTIRESLAEAAHHNVSAHHTEVDTAFLHGELQEEVYMKQPEGYIEPNSENKVCKLQKAIYGLKQAARAWQIKIAESLKKMNFVQSTALFMLIHS